MAPRTRSPSPPVLRDPATTLTRARRHDSLDVAEAAPRPRYAPRTPTLNGCVVGRTGATGNSTKLGTVTNAQGERLFEAVTPGPTTGTLSTGLVKEADATLHADYSPKTRFRITRKSNPDGSYT